MYLKCHDEVNAQSLLKSTANIRDRMHIAMVNWVDYLEMHDMASVGPLGTIQPSRHTVVRKTGYHLTNFACFNECILGRLGDVGRKRPRRKRTPDSESDDDEAIARGNCSKGREYASALRSRGKSCLAAPQAYAMLVLNSLGYVVLSDQYFSG